MITANATVSSGGYKGRPLFSLLCPKEGERGNSVRCCPDREVWLDEKSLVNVNPEVHNCCHQAIQIRGTIPVISGKRNLCLYSAVHFCFGDGKRYHQLNTSNDFEFEII